MGGSKCKLAAAAVRCYLPHVIVVQTLSYLTCLISPIQPQSGSNCFLDQATNSIAALTNNRFHVFLHFSPREHFWYLLPQPNYLMQVSLVPTQRICRFKERSGFGRGY